MLLDLLRSHGDPLTLCCIIRPKALIGSIYTASHCYNSLNATVQLHPYPHLCKGMIIKYVGTLIPRSNILKASQVELEPLIEEPFAPAPLKLYPIPYWISNDCRTLNTAMIMPLKIEQDMWVGLRGGASDTIPSEPFLTVTFSLQLIKGKQSF